MNLSTYTFTLSLRSTQSQLCLPVTAGDTSRTLRIAFTDGMGLYDLKGIQAKIGIKNTALPSSEEPLKTESVRVDERRNVVEYDFNKGTCPNAGLYLVQVCLYKEGRQIASPKFSLDAEESILIEEE